MVERILLKHLSGSKATEVATFTLPLAKEIIFGRDAAAQVRFDPLKDDLVSRLHARLSQSPDNSSQFILTDLNSRNGSFVNKIRIVGSVELSPGDVIQLGGTGPEIQFDLDPRPVAAAPATRLIADPGSAQTRESPVPTSFSNATRNQANDSGQEPSQSSSSAGSSRGVGQATVERLIHQSKSSNRKLVASLSAGIIALVLVIAGALLWHNKQEADKTRDRIDASNSTINRKLDNVSDDTSKNTTATNAGQRIAQDYIDSTVFLEVSWKLIHIDSGKQIYHAYKNGKEMAGMMKLGSKQAKDFANAYKKSVPVYITNGKSIQPYVAIEEEHNNKPIGGRLTGTGFVVTPNGFILTNRHVAAAWEDDYFQDESLFPAFLVTLSDTGGETVRYVTAEEGAKYRKSLLNWVPANAVYNKPSQGKLIEGRIDYLYVTFPKTTLPVRATLEQVSDSADVALLKIERPHAVPSVKLCEKDCLNVGEMVTVLGYPDISAEVYAKGASYTPFRREGSTRIIPNPTVTRGNVQKIIKGEVNPVNGPSVKYVSPFGDLYQLAINTAGAGNSGGPVFNDQGQVVGIFTYGKISNDRTVRVSMAVPIKHGLDLMGIQRVIK